MKKQTVQLIFLVCFIWVTAAHALAKNAQLPKNFDAWLASYNSENSASGATEESRTDLPVLVIGAGPAGLAVMAELSANRISFVGVEQHSRVGGLWDQTNPESPAYDSLTTNSSKTMSALGNFPIKTKTDFLSHEHAFIYLNQFAQDRNILSFVRLNTRVKKITKMPDGSWKAILTDSLLKISRSECFRAVVIASGANSKSNVKFPKEFAEQAKQAGISFRHSADYRNNQHYAGKSVLIVGLGNSGAEIAREVSQVAKQTYLSIRTSPWIVPLSVFGIPSDKFSSDSPKWVPHSIEMFFFHLLQRAFVGHPSKLGLGTPGHGILDKFPVCDRGISQAIRYGAIVIQPPIREMKDGKVYFKNRISLENQIQVENKVKSDGIQIDEIIFATGFKQQFKFLPSELRDVESLPNGLSFQIFHPTEQNLLLMTQVNVLQGVWPVFSQQARAIAAYFRAEEKGFSTIQEFAQLRQNPTPNLKGALFAKEDHHYVDADLYIQYLQKLASWFTFGSH